MRVGESRDKHNGNKLYEELNSYKRHVEGIKILFGQKEKKTSIRKFSNSEFSKIEREGKKAMMKLHGSIASNVECEHGTVENEICTCIEVYCCI
jgi:hypothetical protein